eukprot:CAMPEP_0176136326 /NCGR_PEP_ID=MMETSP0120_2-20121206/69180_1 /TAXON_ID=160619 /ORGANISM="Kryptoperidinium foliaceum, Strain CCMP 1326" /LENGTH=36 /DNA_ID= /DNA_START= /DNA_END= /DNA_ORIENTATION=
MRAVGAELPANSSERREQRTAALNFNRLACSDGQQR